MVLLKHESLPEANSSTFPRFVLAHYALQYKKFVPCCYLLIALCDGTMALVVTIQTATFLNMHGILDSDTAPDVPAPPPLNESESESERNISGPPPSGLNQTDSTATTTPKLDLLVVTTALWCWLYRVSVFVNLLLSVARTIKIRNPFSHVNMRAALISVAIYTVIWLIVTIYDLVETLGTKKSEKLGQYYEEMKLGATIAGILYTNYDEPNEATGDTSYYGASLLFILMLIPFIIPSLISLICLILLSCSLRRAPPSEGSAVRQKHVTVTVTWLTLVFVVCTSTSTIFWLFYEYIGNLVLDSHSKEDASYDQIYAFFSLTLPLLNALLSPLIIFGRSQEFRTEFVSKLWKRSSKS